jgi:hypothetical protein
VTKKGTNKPMNKLQTKKRESKKRWLSLFYGTVYVSLIMPKNDNAVFKSDRSVALVLLGISFCPLLIPINDVMLIIILGLIFLLVCLLNWLHNTCSALCHSRSKIAEFQCITICVDNSVQYKVQRNNNTCIYRLYIGFIIVSAMDFET